MDVEEFEKKFNVIKDYVQFKGPYFNIFDILGGSQKEDNHTRFLCELLNPYGTHGLGHPLLQSFLNLEQIAIKDNNIDETYWKVNAEQGISVEGGKRRLDIVISNKTTGHLIVIENKIHDRDRKDQLASYYNWMMGHKIFTDKSKKRLIYLTPNGEPSKLTRANNDLEAFYRCMSYDNDIRPWLEEKMSEIAHPRVKQAMRQYIQSIFWVTSSYGSAKMPSGIMNCITFLSDQNILSTTQKIWRCFPTIFSDKRVITVLEETNLERYWGLTQLARNMAATTVPAPEEDIKIAAMPENLFTTIIVTILREYIMTYLASKILGKLKENLEREIINSSRYGGWKLYISGSYSFIEEPWFYIVPGDFEIGMSYTYTYIRIGLTNRGSIGFAVSADINYLKDNQKGFLKDFFHNNFGKDFFEEFDYYKVKCLDYCNFYDTDIIDKLESEDSFKKILNDLLKLSSSFIPKASRVNTCLRSL